MPKNIKLPPPGMSDDELAKFDEEQLAIIAQWIEFYTSEALRNKDEDYKPEDYTYDAKPSKDLIELIIKEPESKEIFQDKYKDVSKELTNLDKWYHSWIKYFDEQTDDPDSTYPKDWIGVDRKDLLVTYAREKCRLKSSSARWHSLLMKNQGIKAPQYQLNKERFEEEIAVIKTVPIMLLLPNHPPAYETAGRIKLLCPLPDHAEKSASFTIYVEDNNYHCFGCQSSGDNIDLVQKVFGLGFKEAINHIKQYG